MLIVKYIYYLQKVFCAYC